MLDGILSKIRAIIPSKIFSFFQPAYHLSLSFLAALWYGFPSRRINVIAITGTKGKSSTAEILNAILEEAGYRTAVSNTIRFKIDKNWQANLYKMSMPGRFAMQRFLHQAVKAKCDYAIIEMTSQGALLYRHRYINLDTFVFTNLSPEHIEAHGSYEKYADAKTSICRGLRTSCKKNKTIVINQDDSQGQRFMECQADHKILYGLNDVKPYSIKTEGIDFTFGGRAMRSPLSGLFNLYNILAAMTVAKNLNVSIETMIHAVEKFSDIPGRVQKIEAGQSFSVVVDYAHTPDSLEKFYQVFHNSRNICVLGGTGGGRDTWKRQEMGRIAEKYCAEIILTNEDPYDEDPRKIVDDVAKGIVSKKPTIIMDRRQAIHEACRRAQKDDAVLITGKGTDPYIMGPNGSKIPWSDAQIASQEIKSILSPEVSKRP